MALIEITSGMMCESKERTYWYTLTPYIIELLMNYPCSVVCTGIRRNIRKSLIMADLELVCDYLTQRDTRELYANEFIVHLDDFKIYSYSIDFFNDNDALLFKLEKQ